MSVIEQIRGVPWIYRNSLTSELSRTRRCPSTSAYYTVLYDIPSFPVILPLQPTMRQTPSITDPSERFRSIFDKALKAYTKKTGRNLLSLPLFRDLNACESPEEILDKLRDPNLGFGQPDHSDGSLSRCLIPTVKVLYALSTALAKVADSVRLRKLNAIRSRTIV